MFKKLPALLLSTALLPVPLSAQEGPSLLDAIQPERLVQYLVQSGIMALRTQVDLKYSDMSVWLGGRRYALNDVRLWPLPDWDENSDCEIAIDRLVLRGASLDVVDRFELQLSGYGAQAPMICLPPDMRAALEAVGIEALSFPEISLRMGYDIPSAAATVSLTATAEDLAEIGFVAEFPYLWMDARADPDEPMPVVFLSRASLSVETFGLWEKVSPLIPAPFADPSGSPLAVEGLVGTGLLELNQQASEEPASLSGAQRAFLASVKESWPAFLKDPQRLLVETEIEDPEGVFLDFEYYKEEPASIFEDLQPRLALVPASAAELVDLSLLSAVIGGEMPDLAAPERRKLGFALLEGKGAPRDVAAGTAILRDLALAGDADAALRLAQSMRDRAPETAYGFALAAGQGGQPGAAALLDRLEQALPFATILDLQASAGGAMPDPAAAELSLPEIRAEARARITGIGAVRSYAGAALWASLAAAAGDAEGAALLSELDERARLASAAGAARWESQLAEASQQAMILWVEQDMPSRLRLE
ncbi:hypothetical protein R3X27_09350 [Tropicimonas sp. TH_r6]|uniref:hypothetical protein n=1 Tax=Tropicimonas sp. TH_r6 TaxID=3082085 RepID=UPI002953832D|nr:hypothetical protein [Tropicimonas sp. TH_r6]MDV7142890.1 hypothetical protein [Tropicimonas sp. TH_r6]